ncbi:MAG: hypothetical protein K2W94_05645 [Alphaproteobacteria bacterium]|nr:hypothetical protein [Alphaproteobacteria bacterium]
MKLIQGTILALFLSVSQICFGMEDPTLAKETAPIIQGTIAESIAKGERAELDPLVFGEALIKSRLTKYLRALETIDDNTLTPEEKIRSFISFETKEAKEKGEESHIIEGLRKTLNLDIDFYKNALKIVDKIKEEESKKDELLSDLYYLMSFSRKESISLHNNLKAGGFKMTAYEGEEVFYGLIMDVIGKNISKPCSFIEDYLYVAATDDECVSMMINWDILLAEIKRILDPILKHPFVEFRENKVFKGELDEKTQVFKLFSNDSLTLQIGELATKGINQLEAAKAQDNYLGYEIDNREKGRILYFRVLGKFINNELDKLKANLPKIEAYISSFDQWLRDNWGIAIAPLDNSQRKNLHEYLWPKAEKESAPVKGRKKKDKSARSSTSKGVASSGSVMSPPKELTTANIQPVIYGGTLPPIKGHVPNQEPIKEKSKTKGEAVVTQTMADEASDTPAASRFLIENIGKSSWVWHVLHGNHPDYGDIRKEFRDFLQTENIAGEWLEKDNKGVIAIVSPIDGKTYVETFHISHGPVNESSRPSWRHAVCDLLKAASIVKS